MAMMRQELLEEYFEGLSLGGGVGGVAQPGLLDQYFERLYREHPPPGDRSSQHSRPAPAPAPLPSSAPFPYQFDEGFNHISDRLLPRPPAPPGRRTGGPSLGAASASHSGRRDSNFRTKQHQKPALPPIPSNKPVSFARTKAEQLLPPSAAAHRRNQAHDFESPSSTELHTDTSQRTQDLTVLSCDHGRMRRQERGIGKTELQAAVKYGRRERGNPGRDGSGRWRFTHKGVVYITDESCRHEITSWRLEGAPPMLPGAAVGAANSSHVVLVVDHSGSMRKNDVPGYPSRTAAVYDCLARDFVEPQLKANVDDSVRVTLIEMSDTAHVAIERVPINIELMGWLEARTLSRAKKDGNYLPALDKVWQPCPSGRTFRRNPRKPMLQQCTEAKKCRKLLQDSVQTQCLQKLERIGDIFGRDRVHISTVAFGPPNQDYQVLEAMAQQLPRSSFQKLGLSADKLKNAFTSITSDLSTMTTTTDRGGRELTTRVLQPKAQSQLDQGSGLGFAFVDDEEWDIYLHAEKEEWDLVKQQFVRARYDGGIAVHKHYFSKGAERAVFHCTEVLRKEYAPVNGRTIAARVGTRVVGKETLFEEKLLDYSYHREFCRTQGEASQLAELFNRRVNGRPEWEVNFLPCVVYEVYDTNFKYPEGKAKILVEAELEGAFTKWNNNNGVVRRPKQPPPSTRASIGGSLNMITELDEGEAEEGSYVSVDDVPQAFSHFTHTVSNGKKLVCDLQGVWNSVDGFMMTDPVIHYVSSTGRKHCRGATDKGKQGMVNFFGTHKCNGICRRLGLKMPDDL